jgi:hypothetical protein
MAFLAPLAAKGAAASAATGLGAGLKIGTTIGLKAAPSVLAPALGSTLPTGSLLTAGGGGLGGLGGAGGLLGGSGALLPKFASLGGGGGSLLTGGGLGGALTPTGLASLQMPAGSLLKSGALTNPFSAVNQATGLGNISTQAGNLTPELIKTSGAVKDAAIFDPSKGLIGNAPKISNLKAPTGTNYLTDGLRAADGIKVNPITATTPVNQGPLAFREAVASGIDPSKGFLSNAVSLAKNPSMQGAMDYIETHPVASAGAAYGLYNLAKGKPKQPGKDASLIRPYDFTRETNPDAFEMGDPMYAATPGSSAEQLYFDDQYTALTPYEAPGPEYRKAAEGGLMGLAVGGPVETMSAMNAVGSNMRYPQAQLQTSLYSNPLVQRPESMNVISPGEGPAVGAYSGEQKFAGGGLSDLGGYSDGGRLLKGPGDGVSDSIPAVIGNRQPARLADGEFVVPARIVSEIGNGSTEAGARKLYAMMDRVQKARRKTVGKNKVAANTRADKYLPA